MSEKFWTWFNTEAKPKLGGRADTFEAMFKYLDTFARSVLIVETGCVRREGNWDGDGCSTLLFQEYVRDNGGRVHSVDIDPQATALCRALVSDEFVSVHTGDSVDHLRHLATCDGPMVDLLYLDSFDLVVARPIPAATHHVNELLAALPMITPQTLVVVDDSPGVFYDAPMPHVEIGGKGMFVAQYAESVGADMVFSMYQVGWSGMTEGIVAGSKVDDDIRSLVERARAHVEAGRTINAEHLYRIILGRTTPPLSGVARVAHGEACVFYARIALSKQKFGTACDWYREALNADPRAVEYRLEMIVKALRPMANIKIAQQEALKATLIEPDNPQAWRVLGGIEHELGNVKNCIAAYDTQLELAPDDPNAMLDRITIALDVADYGLSRELIEKIMKTERRPDALHCLAMIEYREGRHEVAVDLYQKAIDEGCHDPASAHWNRSLALHSIGRYREGWKEHEWRKFERNNPALSLPMLRFAKPMFTGKEPPPAIIHVHAEAGMGDNLCMARYLPLLVDMGYTVRYETHEDMISLLARSMPMVEIVKKAADYPGVIGLKDFDYHLPIGSLPDVFETDIDSVPANVPYLGADPELVGNILSRIADMTGSTNERRVGLCWSSGIREGIWISEYGRRKSMRLRTLLPIFKNKARFFSLQVGPERAELAELEGLVFDVLPQRPTWDDTAALIETLDLVITVDTAVAHLAGAMGVPVWLMMHTEGSWHFMCERPGASWNERSPWYPNTKLYRQKTAYDWREVVQRITTDLAVVQEVARVA